MSHSQLNQIDKAGQGPLLLTWFNFDIGMDMESHAW